jgi:integrase
MKFTQSNVVTIRPPAGEADHWEQDDGFPGFFIRFRNGGESAYFMRWGRAGKLPLGKVSQVRLATAQDAAREHFGKLTDKAYNPVAERAKATAASATLMPSLLAGFESYLANKRRSGDHIKRTIGYLKDTFAALHVIPIAAIDRATVARELGKIEQTRGPIAMSRARAALSKFFSFCREQGHDIANPVDGTTRHESEARDRVLTPNELRVIWQTAGDGDYGRIIRLLMLTGARRSQLGDLRKTEVRLEASAIPTQDRLIELPAQGRRSARKGGSKHGDKFLIPLSTQAIELLAEKAKAPREGSDYIFGNGKGEGGFSGWSKSKEMHCERIGDAITEPWGFHDFRRSLVTLGHDVVGIPEIDLDHCINHKPASKQGVRGRYNYASHLKEKRAAMQTWADYLDGLVHPKPHLARAG